MQLWLPSSLGLNSGAAGSLIYMVTSWPHCQNIMIVNAAHFDRWLRRSISRELSLIVFFQFECNQQTHTTGMSLSSVSSSIFLSFPLSKLNMFNLKNKPQYEKSERVQYMTPEVPTLHIYLSLKLEESLKIKYISKISSHFRLSVSLLLTCSPPGLIFSVLGVLVKYFCNVNFTNIFTFYLHYSNRIKVEVIQRRLVLVP